MKQSRMFLIVYYIVCQYERLKVDFEKRNEKNLNLPFIFSIRITWKYWEAYWIENSLFILAVISRNCMGCGIFTNESNRYLSKQCHSHLDWNDWFVTVTLWLGIIQ